MGLSFFALLKRPAFWLGTLLTVVVFSVLINLGLWQLSRGNEKQQIEQQVSQYAQQEPITFKELGMADQGSLTGRRVQGLLTPIAGKTLLLDNQTFEGQVGYLAYQLVQQSDTTYALMERGFVAAAQARSELPEVVWMSEPLYMQARLYQKSLNPLSHDLHLEAGTPHRIQNLNIEALAQMWSLDIAPYVIQPQMDKWPYPQPWRPVSLSSDKHFGYAVQWFAMAVALCLLSGWVFFKALRKGVSDE